MLRFLCLKRHPCYVEAPLLASDATKSKKFPVVLFSHGLGGSIEMYTELCRQVASNGLIVVAMEHEDGSACFAETEEGKRIVYDKPANDIASASGSSTSPASFNGNEETSPVLSSERDTVINFRKPFVAHRVKETIQAMQYVQGGWKTETGGRNAERDDLFIQVLESIDVNKGIALLGHSFGGASLAQTAMELQRQKHHDLLNQINSLSMLDPWVYALDRQSVRKGVPPSIPSISIMSEEWSRKPEGQVVLEYHASKLDVKENQIHSRQELGIQYMPRSAHSSFSDAAWMLPGVITRSIGIRGPNEKRSETIQACSTACSHHIFQSIQAKGRAIGTHKKDTGSKLLQFPWENTLLKVPDKILALST